MSHHTNPPSSTKLGGILGAAVLTLVVGTVVCLPSQAQERPRTVWSLEAAADGLAIGEGDRPVLFYQRATKDFEGKFARAHYVHPLYDLDSNVLTEDFPADHRHHRGMFWTWHQVRVEGRKLGDPWACERFRWNVTDLMTAQPADGSCLVRTVVQWESPDWQPTEGDRAIVTETTYIRVEPATDDRRIIDFDIRLQARADGVTIGGSEDDKGYGGFSARLKLDPPLRFLGREGAVTPQRTAVSAGNWMNMVRANQGVAILTHPHAPQADQPWILRAARSMQNPRFPGREPHPVPKSHPLRLWYRVILHRGNAESDWLAKAQQDFAAAPLPDWSDVEFRVP